jgi:hypothetical protein
MPGLSRRKDDVSGTDLGRELPDTRSGVFVNRVAKPFAIDGHDSQLM